MRVLAGAHAPAAGAPSPPEPRPGAPAPAARVPRREPGLRLADRILLANALVFIVAAALLAATPFGVSYPASGKELLALAIGVAAMIAVDGVLVRRALVPLRQLRESMLRIDPLEPGERLDLAHAAGDLSELAGGFNEMADRLEAERRESARRTLAGREEERRALARELHDEVGQTLTAVLAHLNGVAKRAPEELAEPLREGQEGARAALEQVRTVVNRLRPDTLEDLGLVSALRALSRRIEAQTGLRVSLSLEERLPALDPDAELVVYRIAQEALTNTVRHAQARTVAVVLLMDDRGLRLVVRDDGRGVPDRLAGMTGIRGMRERALLVGGHVEVGRTADGGTEVCLRIPTLEAHR